MSNDTFSFEIIESSKQYSNARLGLLRTPHGVIETPAFIFCATKANIKGVTIDHVKNEGTQIILSNTYHLMLQPTGKVIREAGGLHAFTGWDGPMLTDSGGFQIFSLGHGSVSSEIKSSRGSCSPDKKLSLLKIDDDGAVFRSYIDGSVIKMTPEISMQMQIDLGADMIVSFDECTPYHVSKEYTALSMRKSKEWGLRSLRYLNERGDGSQRLLAVIQGGVYEDLRLESVDFANENGFFGFAVGGSLGQTTFEMREIVSMVMEMLDRRKNVHLLGIGGIDDIFHGIRNGVDTFDCVSPTRIARHGTALVKYDDLKNGKRNINLNNGIFRGDHSPISPNCPCYTCQKFTRAYIHHLLKAKECLGGTLITIHNIHTMNRLMTEIRGGIKNDDLNRVCKEWGSE
ncbi:MAG: tRNA guanosine(34) transglycosylase Tgt [Holosporales bacterium]|jgi:queuine tRNA-ribosyltransferase|nr:tRNA guanosine(34) transglycosylase Tgt [Holosporales bacterium]